MEDFLIFFLCSNLSLSQIKTILIRWICLGNYVEPECLFFNEINNKFCNKADIHDNFFIYDISFLDKGTYILKITCDDHVYFKKIQKI